MHVQWIPGPFPNFSNGEASTAHPGEKMKANFNN